MIKARIEVGDLEARTEGGRVILESRAAGYPHTVFELSPLAAHNLAVVLPGLAGEAADRVIVESMEAMSSVKAENREEPP